jgi:acetyltransferase-like isoleucine patch superfamily enzyme
VNTAGRGMKIDTFIVEPVNIQIGSKFYKTELYVALIGDDMLLGLNFMVTYNVTVDMGRSKFIIGHNEFHLNSDKNTIIPAKVSIPQRTVIPPNTVVNVNGQLDTKMENYIVEQCNYDLPVLVSRCYCKDQDQPRLCIANTTDRSFTIKGIQSLP